MWGTNELSDSAALGNWIFYKCSKSCWEDEDWGNLWKNLYNAVIIHSVVSVEWLSSQKETSSKDDAQRKAANILLQSSRLKTWVTGTMSCKKLIWFRWCQACVAATRWRVQRQLCLAYSGEWWWECHGLGLHECCRHWGAKVEGTMNANMYCDIMMQSMIPSLW